MCIRDRGLSVYSDQYPVVKNNNAVLAFDSVDAENLKETACIRCGRCIRACPYHLMPASFEAAYKAHDLETLKKLKVCLLYTSRCV